jgi:hypothetical protein
MTFEEYYKYRYPDLDPEQDDFYQQLKDCWYLAYTNGKIELYRKIKEKELNDD